MEIEGKKIICDRCGKEIFLKRTDTKNNDDGYTVWDFEPTPEGWSRNSLRVDCRTLCPDCNKKLSEIIKQFMEE